VTSRLSFRVLTNLIGQLSRDAPYSVLFVLSHRINLSQVEVRCCYKLLSGIISIYKVFHSTIFIKDLQRKCLAARLAFEATEQGSGVAGIIKSCKSALFYSMIQYQIEDRVLIHQTQLRTNHSHSLISSAIQVQFTFNKSHQSSE
jgi:hypothetical protein